MKKILFLLSACGLVMPIVAEDKVPRIPSPKGAKVMIVLPRDGKTVKGPVRVAFGLKGMVLQNRFTPPLEGTLAKVACGGIEHLPVAQEVNLSRAIETFKDHGYTCIALDERGEKTFKGLDPLPKKAVLVMGAEGPGLRPSVRDACQEVVRLEMKGPLPSINVSNAAAISFYALTN